MTEVMKVSTYHKSSKVNLACLLFLFASVILSHGQEVECPSEGVSYQSHLDCTRYVICVNGQRFSMGCPRPLYYNADERHCDFPENVPKCIRGTRPPAAGSVIGTQRPDGNEESVDSPTDIPPTDSPNTDEDPNQNEGESSSSPSSEAGSDGDSTAPTTENPSTEKPSSSSTEVTTTPPTTALTTTTRKTTTTSRKTTTTTLKTTTTTAIPSFTFPKPGSSVPITKCGETIHANSGAIEYKLNENYEEGELCAFIIRTDNFPHIAFMLDSHGIHDCDTNAITIVNFPNTNTKNVAEYYHFGPPNSIRTRYVNGSAAVVIFKTSSNLGTGFRLSYHASGSPGYPYPGMDFVYNNLTASPVSIPFWNNFTTGYPQKNLIVLTAGGKMITEPGSHLKLTVWESFVCGDFEYFTIFPFDGKSVSRETVYTDDDYADEYRDRRTVFKTQGLFIVEYTQFSEKTGRKRLTWEKVTW